VQHRLVIRVVDEARFLGAAVGGAHAQGAEAGEHVELRDRERRHRVEARGVAEGDQVDPADATGAAGGGAVLASRLAEGVAELAVELGRERAGADAGGVGLGDAPDLVDVLRAGAGAGRRAAGDRVG